MKITLAKPLRNSFSAGAVVVTLSVLTQIPALAQTNTSPGTTPDTITETDIDDDDNDDGFDWGLLGLLGLAGLAGLKRREEPTRYRDPNVEVTTSRPDYRQ